MKYGACYNIYSPYFGYLKEAYLKEDEAVSGAVKSAINRRHEGLFENSLSDSQAISWSQMELYIALLSFSNSRSLVDDESLTFLRGYALFVVDSTPFHGFSVIGTTLSVTKCADRVRHTVNSLRFLTLIYHPRITHCSPLTSFCEVEKCVVGKGWPFSGDSSDLSCFQVLISGTSIVLLKLVKC